MHNESDVSVIGGFNMYRLKHIYIKELTLMKASLVDIYSSEQIVCQHSL